MTIGHPGKQAATNELDPAIRVGLGTRKAKARLAAEGDASSFSAPGASVLTEAHLLRVATIEHLVDDRVVVVCGVAWVLSLENIPVVTKDLLERCLVDVLQISLPRADVIV